VVQKCKIWPEFSTAFAFQPPSFRNEARDMKLEANLGSTSDGHQLLKK